MAIVFEYFESNSTGILLVLLLLFSIILLTNWIAWIFSFGRFKGSFSKDKQQGGIFFLFADLMVKIINDFRHFLALVLVVIFALSLAYALWFAKDTEDLAKSVQAIMATLGTLAGSIVGYYFGESAVKIAKKATDESEKLEKVVFQSGDIKEVEPPPGKYISLVIKINSIPHGSHG